MADPTQPTFAKPADWEAGYYEDYETLAEIARRLGPEAAARARRRIEHTLREFIEAQRGTTPMPPPKVLSGRNVYRNEEERRRSQQAIADAEQLLGRRPPPRRPAATKSAEQLIREGREVTEQLRAAIEHAERSKPTTTITTAPNSANELAATLDRLTEECAAKEGIDYGMAMSKVMKENDDDYEQHRWNVMNGRVSVELAPLSKPYGTNPAPAFERFEQGVQRYAEQHGLDYDEAVAKFSGTDEGRELYDEHRKESTVGRERE
jgi:uncharacterized membrane protein YccC